MHVCMRVGCVCGGWLWRRAGSLLWVMAGLDEMMRTVKVQGGLVVIIHSEGHITKLDFVNFCMLHKYRSFIVIYTHANTMSINADIKKKVLHYRFSI